MPVLSNITKLNPAQNPLLRVGYRVLLQALRIAYAKSSTHKAQSILCNSVPKSGTNLLFQMVECLPNRRNFDTLVMGSNAWWYRDASNRDLARQILKFRCRECCMGHVRFSQEASEALAAANAIHLFIVRDLRDVVISEVAFYTQIATWHRLHPEFAGFQSDSERFLRCINGFERTDGSLFADIGTRARMYVNWLRDPYTLTTRFEDLANPHDSSAVEKLAQHLVEKLSWVDADDLSLIIEKMRVAKSATHRSKTFRKGKANGWRDVLGSTHLKSIEEKAGDILNEFGYTV